MQNRKIIWLAIFTLVFISNNKVLALEPSVSTLQANNVSQNSATISGNIQSSGGKPLLNAGFEYGLNNTYTDTIFTNIGYDLGQNLIVATTGGNDGQFYSPRGKIALDDQGYIYIEDTNNERIQKFDPNGNHVLSFGEEGFEAGQFINIMALDVDSNGFIYVANTGPEGSTIQKYYPDGQFHSNFVPAGVFDMLAGVDIKFDSSDNLYVIESNSLINNLRVYKIDPDGNMILQFGNVGFGAGELITPKAITIDNYDNIYILDDYDESVKKYNSNGEFLFEFGGTTGQLPGEFYNPSNLSVDSFNQIYVSDNYNNRIQIFNDNGEYLNQLNTELRPGGIYLDSENSLYVFTHNYDNGLNIVFKFKITADPINVSNLKCGQLYSFRFFASNGDGTGYGNNVNLNTNNCRPNVRPDVGVGPVKPSKPVSDKNKDGVNLSTHKEESKILNKSVR